MLVLLVLLRGPALIGAGRGNAGMLALRDQLLAQADLAPGTYPLFAALRGSTATVHVVDGLRRAVNLAEDSLHWRWALGRAVLAVGDGKMAADALRPLAGKMVRSPLPYLDTLVALSYGGRPEEVVALRESVPPVQNSQVISEAVALAYLELATRGQGDTLPPTPPLQGGEEGGRRWLEQAHALRPGDLYANYYLWKRAQEAGDAEAAAAYREALTHFPLEAIQPADGRLLDYAARVIPALLEDDLWHREKVLNVVSFLVWQAGGAVGTEPVLERLIERYPAEPDWPFYLAGLHHRRGDLERAEAAYRRALEVDPGYARAYLGLGMLYQAQAAEERDGVGVEDRER